MTTALQYSAAFDAERVRSYPAIDAFEARAGFSLDRGTLEAAARVLACPVKAHTPSWQHGRVIYAAACQALRDAMDKGLLTPLVLLVDIGTAKGFSALCLRWALAMVCVPGRVVSLDVIDPSARVSRNTVAECEGLKTLSDILAPWPDAGVIEFIQSPSTAWLSRHTDRIHVAVVDGKHTYEAVSADAALIAARQQSGDLAIFDDLQLTGVARAVGELRGYAVETIASAPDRVYAIARRT